MTEKELQDMYFKDSSASQCILVVDDETLKEIAGKCGADQEMLMDAGKLGVILVNEVELSTDNTRFEGKKPQRYLYYDISRISDLAEGEMFPISFYQPETDQDEQRMFTVAGYADEAALDDLVSMRGDYAWMIMGKQAAAALADSLGYAQLTDMFQEEVRLTFGEDSDELQEYLCSLNEDSDNGITFFNKSLSEIQKTMAQAIAQIVDIMLLLFVLLTSVICFLNMENSIRGRMADRRKEFAILKSVGMTRRQMADMLFWECSGILVSSSVAAAVISILLICGIRYVMSSLFGRLALQIPYLLLVFAVIVAVVAVFLMTFSAFGKERGQNILEDIRQETV